LVGTKYNKFVINGKCFLHNTQISFFLPLCEALIQGPGHKKALQNPKLEGLYSDSLDLFGAYITQRFKIQTYPLNALKRTIVISEPDLLSGNVCFMRGKIKVTILQSSFF
jgi:hypothetical protein